MDCSIALLVGNFPGRLVELFFVLWEAGPVDCLLGTHRSEG